MGGVKPEGNLNLEDQLNLGLRYGVYFENQFFNIIEGGFERASGVDYKNLTQDTNINEDGGFVQYGAGVKHWVTEQFALKAELRHGITFDADNNLFYSLGFAIPFGKRLLKRLL